MSLLLFLFTLVGARSLHAAGVKRFALVIGNGDYQPPHRLKNAILDAEAIAKTLRDIHFEVSYKSNLTHAQMLQAAADFAGRIDGAEIALFYYAGHAVQVDGKNYLLPIDVDQSLSALNLQYRTFVLSTLELDLLSNSQLGIVLLDACRNNPFSENLMAGTRGLTRGLAVAQVPRNTQRVIAYATAAGAVALDGAADHSPFTQALLELLPIPGLSLAELMVSLNNRVMALTRSAQVPYQDTNLWSPIYLGGPPGEEREKLREVTYWNSIEGRRDVEPFREYLRLYPKGMFNELAQRRLATTLGSAPDRHRPPLHHRWQLWLGLGVGAAAIAALGLGLGFGLAAPRYEEIYWK